MATFRYAEECQPDSLPPIYDYGPPAADDRLPMPGGDFGGSRDRRYCNFLDRATCAELDAEARSGRGAQVLILAAPALAPSPVALSPAVPLVLAAALAWLILRPN